MREHIKFKKHLKNFDAEFIQKKLDEGLTVRHLSPIVEIPERRLGEMIKYFNLTVTNCRTTHIINHTYFDEINTEEKAYFLGFLVADGCLEVSKRKSGFLSKRIRFSNSISDKEIIEKFRDVICPSVEIKWFNNSNEVIARKDQSSFKFTSEHMFDTLVEKYGILPRKTYDLDFILPDLGEYMRHFIRGFMDGDGHFRSNSFGLIFTSVAFMNQIDNFFKEREFTTRRNWKKGKTVDYCYFYVNTNRTNIEKMYELLYKDASIFLERKRIKFETEIVDRYKLPLPKVNL